MVLDRSRPVLPIRKSKIRQNIRCESHEETSCKTPIAQNFVAFCRTTSLHGFKHIFEQNSDGNTYFRKIHRLLGYIIWITAVSLGTAFGFYLMMLVVIRFRNTPTITTVESNNYPIWNVAFPGITVCNLNSVYKPSTKELTEELMSRGIRKDKIFSFYSNLAKLTNFNPIDAQFVNIFDTLDQLNYTTERLMLELAMPCQEMFVRCFLLEIIVECDQIFHFSKSSEGFCCSFNYKTPPSKALETKWFGSDNLETPLWRTAGAGPDVGVKLFLDVQPENYVAGRKPYSGANILIHASTDFPESEVTSAVGQPGYEVGIAIVPSVVYTDENVRELDIKRRICRFEDEKHLRIAGTYSFQLCMTECRALTIIKICNCLPFFFPEFVIDNTSSQEAYRQCALRDVQCLAENKHIFSSLEPPAEMQSYFNKTNIGMICDCYPSCTETIYDVSVYTAKRFDTTIHNLPGSMDTTNLTVVKVFFKDLSCIKYRREIYMTWDGVLSSFGGIFALCLGGSVISLIELIYLTICKYFCRSKGYKVEPLSILRPRKALPDKELIFRVNRVKQVNNIESKNQITSPMEYQFLL